jgi:hypothetical protein
MTCSSCIYFQQEEVAIPLPVLGDLVQNTYADAVIGESTYRIARCNNGENTVDDVTRAVETADFMNDSENQKVFTHSGILAVAEGDTCPFYSAAP